MNSNPIINAWSRIFSIILIYSFVSANVAQAQGRGLSLIRDAEIEQIIRDITEPIFEAAELDKDAVKTYLLNDNTINAFVMGGQNVFINSGLLLEAEKVNQVMGVIAHETGHITGGHLSRMDAGMSQMMSYSLLGVLLGIGAMAAGSADAGMALMMGGQHVGYRSLLKFTRTQESSADQAAITFLEKAGISGKGLLEFFEILGDQELVPERYQDPYASTHPMNSIRITRLQDQVAASQFVDRPTDPVLEEKFKLLQAKLFGYLKAFHATMVKYPKKDKSSIARYARTFAYQKDHKTEEALLEINSLIEESPDNPFYYETKAQILYEDGRVIESLEPYKNAVNNLPNSALLRMSYAQAMISSDDDQYLEEAIENLEISLRIDPINSFGWKQASIAYHRSNNAALTHYSTAQHFLMSGDLRGAMVNAQKAAQLLPKNTPRWIKAQDILVTTQSNMSERQRTQQEKQQKENTERRQKERNRSR
ncbi:MAG: M48 family metallopeptidase [Kordiimonadaceae bacterium]|jgi:predicted Zn-dependent protease|nr:M48 family metallopeptidase [Kordiimonadaceae bacterium]MBT6033629.1 M48 family metallopeptidase [Kordiimonadaceae bacterium]